MLKIYSTVMLLIINISYLQSKKRTKYFLKPLVSGDIAGARQHSWTFVKIIDSDFITIYKPLEERIMWQDPFLTQWEGAHSRTLLDILEIRHQWNNDALEANANNFN